MKMFCITINNNHCDKIKKLGYLPVGLGTDITDPQFHRDNVKEICDFIVNVLGGK